MIDLANQVDELVRMVEELRRFMLGDYRGLIDVHDAALLLRESHDALLKECQKESRKQLVGVKEDRFFEIRKGRIRVLRYKEHPKDIYYGFMLERSDCIQYMKEW